MLIQSEEWSRLLGALQSWGDSAGRCWRCCLMFSFLKGANIFPPWLGQLYFLLDWGKYISSLTGTNIFFFYISWHGQIYFLLDWGKYFFLHIMTGANIFPLQLHWCRIFIKKKFCLIALPVLSDVQLSLQECQCGGQNWPQVKRERSKGFVWPSDILEIRVSNFVTKWR